MQLKQGIHRLEVLVLESPYITCSSLRRKARLPVYEEGEGRKARELLELELYRKNRQSLCFYTDLPGDEKEKTSYPWMLTHLIRRLLTGSSLSFLNKPEGIDVRQRTAARLYGKGYNKGGENL